MHLIVPFAAPLSDAGRAAAAELRLPRLGRLLQRWAEADRDSGDEFTLSPPHERALARALGWHGGNGLLPWAARAAQADGVATDDLAWGLLTPVHWHVGSDRLSLLDPAALQLGDAESRAFFDAVLPLFSSEGFVLHWGAALRWYLAHESLAGLPTASLDRVIGRNVDAWLGEQPALRLLRRLQNEVQMLLYTHPANAEREQRGLPTVNSFWLSGCGVAQPCAAPEPRVDDSLRSAALAEDWPAWTAAWQALDAGALGGMADADAGVLTLCGERSAARFEPRRGAWSRWAGRWSAPDAHRLLEGL